MKYACFQRKCINELCCGIIYYAEHVDNNSLLYIFVRCHGYGEWLCLGYAMVVPTDIVIGIEQQN